MNRYDLLDLITPKPWGIYTAPKFYWTFGHAHHQAVASNYTDGPYNVFLIWLHLPKWCTKIRFKVSIFVHDMRFALTHPCNKWFFVKKTLRGR